MVKLIRKDLVAVALPVALGALWWAVQNVPPPVSSSDWASWVQGIGTMIAVAVSAWVGLIPVTLAREARRASKIDFITAVIGSTGQPAQIVDIIGRAVDDHSTGHILRAHQIVFEAQTFRALDKILEEPMSAWPSSTLYITAAQFRDAVQAVLAFPIPMQVTMYPDGPDPFWTDLGERVERAREMRRIMIEVARKAHDRA